MSLTDLISLYPGITITLVSLGIARVVRDVKRLAAFALACGKVARALLARKAVQS